MCDTLALKRDGAVWFAKNSDREPDEMQIVERCNAPVDDTHRADCTYISVETPARRFGALISRPAWMWGAEMGVNDASVAIGNEAVFSRCIDRRGEALLGMDLVRIGLECSESAAEAVAVIAALLARYGQGGPAGYRDKRFRYDNSFLIADAKEIYVLETAGRDYAAKRVSDCWSISNAYTLETEFDQSSGEFVSGFRKTFETTLMPMLACARDRRAATLARAQAATAPMTLSKLADILRTHGDGDGFDRGSNRDVCMHAEGLLRPHATTAAMVARLAPGAPPVAAFTHAPAPCVSPFLPAHGADSAAIWRHGAERRLRAAKDKEFRRRIRALIAECEPRILAAIEAGANQQAVSLAEEWARRVADIAAQAPS